VKGKHILREANQVADTFTKEELNQPMHMHIFVNVPMFCYSEFIADN